MFGFNNLIGDLQNELAEKEKETTQETIQETTQENPEKNEEKKSKKKIKKAENTAFDHGNNQNNILEKKEEKKTKENEEKIEEKISNAHADEDEDFVDVDPLADANGNSDDLDLNDQEDFDDDEGDDDENEDDDDEENDEGDDDNDDFDDGDIPEGDDPLKGFEQDSNKETQKVKAEEIIPPTSPKNLKNIEKLSKVALARVDVMKAKACANISGQHMAEYLADEEMMNALFDAIKEYVASMEYKPPTPFGTLVITVLLWGVPSFGLALWHKYSMPKPAPTQSQSQETTSTNFNQAASDKPDYSHLKEFQDVRKVFAINKQKGTYSATANGTFVKLEHADEYPSLIVLQWINEGLTNKEIREKLYGK